MFNIVQRYEFCFYFRQSALFSIIFHLYSIFLSTAIDQSSVWHL